MTDTQVISLLVVEDDMAHAVAIERVFEDSSGFYSLQIVGSIREFAEAVARKLPDIVLVDIHLPDGSAEDLLAAQNKAGLYPILVMTSHGSEQQAVQAIKAGALDYLVKSPESFAALPHTVRRALREWKLVESHRRAEEALRESQEIFQQFMEHSPTYVFFKDESIRALRLSRNYEQLLGKPLSELIGKNMDDLFPSDLAKSMIEDDKRILREGKPIVVDEEFNGRFFTTIKFPIFHEGAARYLAGYTIDVTERHRAEAALREKNAELEEAFAKVKALSGLLPICSGCKKIRDDKGYWSQVECYIQQHSEVTFTHGMCPDCLTRYFPDVKAEDL